MDEHEIKTSIGYLVSGVFGYEDRNNVISLKTEYPIAMTTILHVLLKYYGYRRIILHGQNCGDEVVKRAERMQDHGWTFCRIIDTFDVPTQTKRQEILLCYKNDLDSEIPDKSEILKVLKQIPQEDLIDRIRHSASAIPGTDIYPDSFFCQFCRNIIKHGVLSDETDVDRENKGRDATQN